MEAKTIVAIGAAVAFIIFCIKLYIIEPWREEELRLGPRVYPEDRKWT